MPKNNLQLIGIVGDQHLRSALAYADYIADKRAAEQQKVLDTIVESLKDCNPIVFMGDQLHGKNNPSSVIKTFVSFIEKFKDKTLYFLVGNHETFSDGTTAIDFIEEIKDKPWYVIKGISMINNMVFCPYIDKAELNLTDNGKAAKKLLSQLTSPKLKLNSKSMLFIHQAISNSPTTSGSTADLFNEIVLPRTELEKHYGFIAGGHIHQHYYKGKTLVAGSVFTNEAGETEKNVWKLNPQTLKAVSVPLPVMPIYSLTDPDIAALKNLSENAIVKTVFTKKQSKDDVEAIKRKLRKFSAFILIEQYPRKRSKIHFDEGMLEFSVEQLLEMYAKARKIDLKQLLFAYDLIK